MKVCSSCKREKFIADFYEDKRRKDGLMSRCKSCHGVSVKTWQINNLIKTKEINRTWDLLNPVKKAARFKRWYESHREESIQRTRSWERNNPEKAKTAKANNNRRRRASKKGTDTRLTKEEWAEILEDYSGLCFWCGAPWEHQDHLIPLSKGGAHSKENVVPACEPCNLQKSNKDPLTFLLEISAK